MIHFVEAGIFWASDRQTLHIEPRQAAGREAPNSEGPVLLAPAQGAETTLFETLHLGEDSRSVQLFEFLLHGRATFLRSKFVVRL